jgi:4-hydroxythreonine-4-phosphate dehydrogenase
MTIPPLALTMGDPAGVGPELAARAWHALRDTGRPFVWIGDPLLLDGHAPYEIVHEPGHADAVFASALPVLPLILPAPVTPGTPDPANGAAVVESIARAVELTLLGRTGAVVTTPIAKSVLRAGGFQHPGHTEYLADLCGVAGQEWMMLASPQLRVVPVTIHVSLRDAIAALSTDLIVRAGRALARALHEDLGASGRIAVAGLNPHAGEEGLMGVEDQTIVAPAIAILRAEGIAAFGPLPPDTMFTEAARRRYDAALCMYHDQALIPLKTLDMAHGVNVTLGLPIVRTSPDHGTAFDIAGTGRADPSSLIAALHMARDMAATRAAQGHIK